MGQETEQNGQLQIMMIILRRESLQEGLSFLFVVLSAWLVMPHLDVFFATNLGSKPLPPITHWFTYSFGPQSAALIAVSIVAIMVGTFFCKRESHLNLCVLLLSIGKWLFVCGVFIAFAAPLCHRVIGN
jgi:hypothetical protein